MLPLFSSSCYCLSNTPQNLYFHLFFVNFFLSNTPQNLSSISSSLTSFSQIPYRTSVPSLFPSLSFKYPIEPLFHLPLIFFLSNTLKNLSSTSSSLSSFSQIPYRTSSIASSLSYFFQIPYRTSFHSPLPYLLSLKYPKEPLFHLLFLILFLSNTLQNLFHLLFLIFFLSNTLQNLSSISSSLSFLSNTLQNLSSNSSSLSSFSEIPYRTSFHSPLPYLLSLKYLTEPLFCLLFLFFLSNTL